MKPKYPPVQKIWRMAQEKDALVRAVWALDQMDGGRAPVKLYAAAACLFAMVLFPMQGAAAALAAMGIA